MSFIGEFYLQNGYQQTVKIQRTQTTEIHELLTSKLKTYIYKDARIF